MGSVRRGHVRKALAAAVASVLTVAALGACATAPRSDRGAPAQGVAGPYVGRFIFQGQTFDATLQLRRATGTSLDGAFRVMAPAEIEGRVRAWAIDDLLRLDIDYRSPGGCDGRIEGILTIESGGAILDGPVTVTDCGGPVAGRVSVRREARRPS